MRVNRGEYLKLTILPEGNDLVLDIRVWKSTPTGGVPTKKAIVAPRNIVIPFIRALQKVHQVQSNIEATSTTEVA